MHPQVQELSLTHHVTHDDVVSVRPVGLLTLRSIPPLRETLLKLAVEQPRAILVEVDALVVTNPTLLSVFSTVWMQTGRWPATPFALVATDPDQYGRLSASTMARFVPVHRSLDDALAALVRPERLRRTATVPASLTAPALARRFVEETLGDWPVTVSPQATHDLVLIANELVENVVCHTVCPQCTLRLEWLRGNVTVAVTDTDPLVPAIAEPGPERQSWRRGLSLIAQLARAWGTLPYPGGGKVVWATVGTE